jgi:predicted N-acetyltransferase YhbS
MLIREMQRADRDAVLDLLERAFRGERELFARYMDFESSFGWDDFLLAQNEGTLVACVQIFAKTVRLRGAALSLGGIGSVATDAAHRGRGVSRLLLEHAIERMRARGMALSLLFAAPVAPLYERLGWRRIPLPLLRLARDAGEAEPAGRPFRAEDLPRVTALYESYTEMLSGPTVRDERYWRGNLRTAGTPGEDFRVCEADGELCAYLRSASFGGRPRAMEYARAPGAADALAALLSAQVTQQALHVPYTGDAELDSALRRRGIATARGENPSAMWRVLEREPLLELAGLSESAGDELLLDALVAAGELTYWPSDRF